MNGQNKVIWWVIGALWTVLNGVVVMAVNANQAHLTQIDNILDIRSERIAILDTNQKSVLSRLDKIDSNIDNLKNSVYDIRQIMAVYMGDTLNNNTNGRRR
jgi:hypothetical protein